MASICVSMPASSASCLDFSADISASCRAVASGMAEVVSDHKRIE